MGPRKGRALEGGEAFHNGAKFFLFLPFSKLLRFHNDCFLILIAMLVQLSPSSCLKVDNKLSIGLIDGFMATYISKLKWAWQA